MDPELSIALECPVCLEIFKPPLYSCPNGHTICSTCKENNIKFCPVCRSHIPGRNIALELIVQLLPLPCKHKGCSAVMKLKILEDHEANCGYRQVPCPSCFTNIALNEMSTHIEQTHLDYILSVELNRLLKFTVDKATNNDTIVWFLRESSTNTLLPYVLYIHFQFEAQRLVLCLAVLGDADPCIFTIELLSSASTSWQKVTYSNEAVRLALDKPQQWQELKCLSMQPASVNLHPCDVMILTLTLTWGGIEARPLNSVVCAYRHLGCFELLPADNILSHERVCGFQNLACIVNDCKDGVAWGHYWNHVQHSHKHCLSILPGKLSTSCLVINGTAFNRTVVQFVASDTWFRYHVSLHVDFINSKMYLGVFIWAPPISESERLFTVTVKVNNTKINNKKYNLLGVLFPLYPMTLYADWKRSPNCMCVDTRVLKLLENSKLEVFVTRQGSKAKSRIDG